MRDLFFERLAELMEAHRMNYSDLARSLDTARSTVAEWRDKLPRPDHMRMIAKAFGVSVDWLLGQPHATQLSPAVLKLRSDVRAVLSRTPECAGATPSQRLALVLQLWHEMDAGAWPDWLMASWLGIGDADLTGLRDGVVEAERGVLQRFAQLSGIPFGWFLAGGTLTMTDGEVQEYGPAVLAFQTAGVSGAELMANLSVLVHMIEHVRRL